MRALAREIDLSKLDTSLHAFNPRVVQPAMYLFTANRRAAATDCMRVAAEA